MFNLIVAGIGWSPNRDTFPAGRALEHTADAVKEKFQPDRVLDLEAVSRLPTLFMTETSGNDDQVAHVGTITRIRLERGEFHMEYTYDPNIPPISNAALAILARDLSVNEWEFSRTHWAIKDVDLFHTLLRHDATNRPTPKVFHLSERPVNPNLVSVMMPFDPRLDGVYSSLEGVVRSMGKVCRRADNIWNHDAIIQDVVELICTSSVVICDLSGKNANVFYEAGIAHTLGKPVIMLTQSSDDVPFDLRHLRYIQYLNNGEGLTDMGHAVLRRLETLLG